MSGLHGIRQVNWHWLCGVAVAIAVAVFACAGPATLQSGDVGAQGGAAGRGGTAGWRGSVGTGGVLAFVSLPSTLPSAPNSLDASPTDEDGGNCGIKASDLTRQPADLLLVLDRSSSMNYGIATEYECHGGDPGCAQRWATMMTALDEVLTALPNGLEWGLKFFPSTTGSGNCALVPGVDLPIPASATEVKDAIKGTSPANMTPTTLAIKEAVAHYKTLNDGRTHNILLATDGQPNCDPTAQGNAAALANAQAAIADAAALGIKVYVIGIGPAVGNLDVLAQAGGTGKYFPAASPDQLTSALNAVASAVASCVFKLGVAPQDAKNVVVEFNGDRNLRAPHDATHTNGWDYTSPSLMGIQLYGSWCENVTNDKYKSVKIIMGCPNLPVP